jgi:hypothetical protein
MRWFKTAWSERNLRDMPRHAKESRRECRRLLAEMKRFRGPRRWVYPQPKTYTEAELEEIVCRAVVDWVSRAIAFQRWPHLRLRR